MNKTVTINISGIIFHIEEDAYESLSKYLSTIKVYFSATEGGNEIMTDIEARIAELLQQSLNAGKQVILLADVDHVKEVMGKPEDFGGEANQSENNTQQNNDEAYQYNEKVKRRLFRNPDEKAIGGVCSGLAAYFDVDIVWVRLAMFLLIFFGGLSLWVYIIMWIIIPEAKSTADRLAMKGEAANVNTIYKSFKEEAEDLKNRASKTFQEETKDFKQRANKFGQSVKNQNYSERVRSNIAIFLSNLFNVVGRLFGLFLVVIGGVLLLAYLASLTGITIINSNTDIQHWKSVIFQSQGIYALSVLAFIIVIGVPVFMLLYAGVKLLFHIRYSNRWINLSLGIIWVLGLILAGFISVVTVKQFSESSRIKQMVELHGMGDTIIIKMRPGAEIIRSLNADNTDDMDTYFSKNHGGFTFAEYNNHLSIIGYAGLNVSESDGDSLELIINQNARGVSKREANSNAKAIQYKYEIKGNELILDQIFLVDSDVKFSGQELDVKLKLPKGKVIYFDKSVKYLLDDIDNTTNTWDGDMIMRRWKMTDKGLACIDCQNLTSVDDHQRKRKENDVVIDEEGIQVNGQDADINIDKDGIRINTPEEEVRIDGDIKVKTKKKNKEEQKEEDNF